MVFKPIIRLATAASVLTLSHKAAAEFGYTDKDGSYVIDTGSDADSSLIVGVSQDNCDLTSILYRDNELQSSETGSQINSGLGSDTIVDITEVDGDVQSIKVTCSTGTLTHYYVFREGSPAIFMATSIEENPSVGELRYIFRLNSEILPEEYPFEDVSNTSGEGETVEGSDVFLIDGETHSKFYSSERYIDRNTHCVYGDEIHVCMLIPQMESSAGGPFFRDIETNNGGSYTSLYNYMNSGTTHAPVMCLLEREG